MCFNPAHQRADSVQHHIYRYLQQTLWKQLWSFVCEARLTVLWWSCWQMHCTGSVLSLWPGSRWALCAVCSAGFACGLWATEIWCGQPNSGNGQVGTHTAMTDVENTFIIIRQTASTISHQLLCVIIVTWWSYDVSLWSTSYNIYQNEVTFFSVLLHFLYGRPLRPSNPLDGSTLR